MNKNALICFGIAAVLSFGGVGCSKNQILPTGQQVRGANASKAKPAAAQSHRDVGAQGSVVHPHEVTTVASKSAWIQVRFADDDSRKHPTTAKIVGETSYTPLDFPNWIEVKPGKYKIKFKAGIPEDSAPDDETDVPVEAGKLTTVKISYGTQSGKSRRAATALRIIRLASNGGPTGPYYTYTGTGSTGVLSIQYYPYNSSNQHPTWYAVARHNETYSQGAWAPAYLSKGSGLYDVYFWPGLTGDTITPSRVDNVQVTPGWTTTLYIYYP